MASPSFRTVMSGMVLNPITNYHEISWVNQTPTCPGKNIIIYVYLWETFCHVLPHGSPVDPDLSPAHRPWDLPIAPRSARRISNTRWTPGTGHGPWILQSAGHDTSSAFFVKHCFQSILRCVCTIAMNFRSWQQLKSATPNRSQKLTPKFNHAFGGGEPLLRGHSPLPPLALCPHLALLPSHRHPAPAAACTHPRSHGKLQASVPWHHLALLLAHRHHSPVAAWSHPRGHLEPQTSVLLRHLAMLPSHRHPAPTAAWTQPVSHLEPQPSVL